VHPHGVSSSGRSSPSIGLADLVSQGVLGPPLAGLLSLLVESRVPLVVAAGPQGTGKSTLLEALLAFLPSGVTVRALAGYAEDFGWLPEAATLGWRPHGFRGISSAGGVDSSAPVGAPERPIPTPERPVGPAITYLLVHEFSEHLPSYTWGEQARIAVRALSLGYGLGGTIHADSLEEVFAELGGTGVGLTDDELSRIGVVLILRIVPHPATGVHVRRIVAAHYVRPVARDAAGHVQRLGPAVLATWDPATDRFEDFSWGVAAELAERVGRKVGDFDGEVARRAATFTIHAWTALPEAGQA